MPNGMVGTSTDRRGQGRIIIDTRWLGTGGPGRVTELLLRGLLAGDQTRLRWATWDGRDVAPLDASALDSRGRDPRVRGGQAGLTRVPRGQGLMVFMHQSRPLIAPRNITLIHDTIQLTNAGGMRDLTVKLGFLRRVVSTSAHVLTVSAWSRRQIVELLGASPDRITVIPNPVDERVAERVRALRDERVDRDPIALYVGRFAEHKNLPRLIRAFRRSRFAADGGRLALVGGSPEECAALTAATPDLRGVEIVPTCTQHELERWYARAALLVQPSLVEGFGLPVAEALAAGIPVCSSDGGALPEVAGGFAELFDPTSDDAIAHALDVTAQTASGRDLAGEREVALAYMRTVRAPDSYARAVEQTLERFGRREPADSAVEVMSPASTPGAG